MAGGAPLDCRHLSKKGIQHPKQFRPEDARIRIASADVRSDAEDG